MYYLAINLTRGTDVGRQDSLLRRALPIFHKNLGQNSLAVAWCLNDIGISLVSRERYREALPPFREAARIKETLLGQDSPDVGLAHNNVAYVESLLGDYADADRESDRAVHIARRVLGSQHPWTAIWLHTRGDVLRRAGRLREAEPLLVEATAIQEANRNQSEELPLSLWTLAALRASLGRYSEAEAGFKRSVALYEAIDPNHPDLVPCLEEFARLRDRMGRSAEAVELRARAAKIRTLVTGPKTASASAVGAK
jgi:tetratricopeptide (TPR) repeat protein